MKQTERKTGCVVNKRRGGSPLERGTMHSSVALSEVAGDARVFGERGPPSSSLPSITEPCVVHGKAGRNRRLFQLIAAGGLPVLSYVHLQLFLCRTPAWLWHRGQPQWVNQVGSPSPSPPPAQRDAGPLSIHLGTDGKRQSDFPGNHSALTTYCPLAC